MLKLALKHLSIRQKLLAMIGLAVGTALLLAFLAFFINHTVTFVQKQRSKLVILGQVLASNSEAAVAFDDPATAKELLGALEAEPYIVSAGTYDAQGQLLADYGEPAPPRLSPFQMKSRGIYYKAAHFHVISPIILHDKRIGTVYIRSGMRELGEILIAYVIAGALIMGLCTLLALYIATRLQREISGPVVRLSSLAQQVSDHKDYSLRAEKLGEDEIGDLVESFNQMLSEIEKRNEALTRSNRDLEQFAYVSSHDLQEPLRMVSSYTDLLEVSLEGKLSDDDTQLYMKYIKEGALRASTLVQDLLQYSRARSQQRPFETLPVQEVLREALMNLKLSIEETQAVVTHDEPLPAVPGDRVKLILLFQNLLGNALKFRSPGTSPRIHISVSETDREWLFSVKDNGIGIDPQYAERIFVIFQRLHHRENYEGTGIGLAICKTIVETHGGKIWVEANPGGGTVFFFTLLRFPAPGSMPPHGMS